MKTLRAYPGVLTMLILSMGFAVNGLVDFINYEIAGPSFLAALALVATSGILTLIYETRSMVRAYKHRAASKKLKRSRA